MKKLKKLVVMLLAVVILAGTVNSIPVQAKTYTNLDKTKVDPNVVDLSWENGADINFHENDVKKKNKKKIKFKNMPKGTTVTYKSDNKKVANVTKYGNIYPKGIGFATVTCTLKYNGQTKKIKIGVNVYLDKEEVKVKGKYNLEEEWKDCVKKYPDEYKEITIPTYEMFTSDDYIYSDITVEGDISEVYVDYHLDDAITKATNYVYDEDETEEDIENNRGMRNINQALVDKGMLADKSFTRYFDGSEKYETAPGTYYIFDYESDNYKNKLKGLKITIVKNDKLKDFDMKKLTYRYDDCQPLPCYTVKKVALYNYENGKFVKTSKSIKKDTEVQLLGKYKNYYLVMGKGFVGFIPREFKKDVVYDVPFECACEVGWDDETAWFTYAYKYTNRSKCTLYDVYDESPDVKRPLACDAYDNDFYISF